MVLKKKFRCTVVFVLFIVSTDLFAASVNFIKIESVFVKPQQPVGVFPYSINIASNPRPFNKSAIKYINELKSNFIYLAKVTVDKKLYYRLVMGNFKNRQQAGRELSRIKKYYPGAWINIRVKQEQQALARLLAPVKKQQSVQKKVVPKIVLKNKSSPVKKQNAAQETSVPKITLNSKSSPDSDPANKLLNQAKQEFLDGRYARVLAITDKIIEVGDDVQKQAAMELSGIVRERQSKFAQAIAIYTTFLELFPDSELAPKIENRLEGLKTMRMSPKQRIARDKRQSDEVDWAINGALSQYYQSSVLDRENADPEDPDSALISNIALFAQRKTETNTLVMRFDGGLVSDIEDSETESQVSRAMVAYTDRESEYQITFGRQSRTAKGIYDRFDGLVYKDLSSSGLNYSIYTGFPVQSSEDGLETERAFVGASINFNPFARVDMDVFILHQAVSDITDREALGTEFQYRGDRGFLYGLIDYDVFYNDLNNFTVVSNYRFSEKWVFDLTYNFRKLPLLSTTNALQGQSVVTISELQTIFSDEEIYQLAKDRTSNSQNVYLVSSYQIDADHQMNLSLSSYSIDATVASGGVAAVPATDDILLAADYTIHNYFNTDDYTGFGLSLSDTVFANIVSFRARTRIPGSGGLRYDTRVRLDYREKNDTEETQWILSPSFKISYRSSKNLSFEATLSFEYSNFNLPQIDDHTFYTLFLGYVYQF